MADDESTSHPGRRGTLLTIIVCALLLGGAVTTVWLINQTEPTAQRETATRQGAMLVETIQVSKGNYQPEIVALGTVEAARDITLSPRVSGQIETVSGNFIPGGFVDQGEVLLTLDPADFENALAMRESALREARATLAIEEGRRTVAEQEFALLDEDIATENRSLVLREPQLESARAQVEAAQAAVEQAGLDLNRTTIKAPFDAQILTREVNIGSQVAPGDGLARLVGTDEYWVIATVPLRDLRWIHFPRDGEKGSTARVRNRGSMEEGVYREGEVRMLIGTVTAQSRLARVLISVPDPLGREKNEPPLILGSVVHTRIQGPPIENVVRLSRDYVREGDAVWVMVEGKLSIRETDIVFRDAEYAYIRDGLADREHVVTTNLATIAEGARLRRDGDPGGSGEDEGDP